MNTYQTSVQVKSSSGISIVPINTRLLSGRKIFIEGDIDAASACEFIKQLMFLYCENSSAAIDVMINSPGGEIDSGLLIYDAIQDCKAPIRMFCLGRAYSMAAVLFACGNNGRFILPHSRLMLHEPLLGSQISGNSSSIKSISDSLIEARKRINRLLAKHTGKTEEELEKATSFEHYFSAEEAKEFGLADKIIGFNMMLNSDSDV
jgi:ATP-dependent Clp protease protease subunit